MPHGYSNLFIFNYLQTDSLTTYKELTIYDR